MANEDNLIPRTTLSTEEAKRMGSKGGKKSAEKRRQNKTFKELCSTFANSKLTNAEFQAKLKNLGIEDEELTNKTAMMVSLYMQVLKGNVKAFEVFRDTMGEQVVQKVEDVTPPKIVDDV